MQPDLSGIHLREEIRADERKQRGAGDRDQPEAGGHQLAMRQRGAQQAAVAVAHALESAV